MGEGVGEKAPHSLPPGRGFGAPPLPSFVWLAGSLSAPSCRPQPGLHGGRASLRVPSSPQRLGGTAVLSLRRLSEREAG